MTEARRLDALRRDARIGAAPRTNRRPMTNDTPPPDTGREPLDVLFAVTTLGAGGMERRCLLLAGALAQRGLRVGILTFEPWSEAVGDIDPRVRVFRLDLAARPFGGWLAFFRLLRRRRPALYQGFGTLAGFPCAVVARLAGVPVVINAFTISTLYFPRWFAPIGWFCFLFTHHAIANSRGVRDSFVRHWWYPARKITTIGNPIETSAWPCRDAALRAEARAELGLSEEAMVIGTVARLTEQKGHRYLFDALARVADDHPEAVLALVGEGPLLGELMAYAEQLGLAGRIRFLGVRRDVPRLLQAFDVFCLPSLYEGMPNVVLEAMAAGLAVVSTEVEGAVELVAPGETGWLTPPADSAALAAALREALGDPERLPAYGLAGRRRVAREFDLAVIMRRYEEFYEPLLPRRR
jgi:glycosyltransferase involved in cell wall biosynthesis